MSRINHEQILCLHNQVQKIIRHFSQSFFTEQAVSKLYRLIRKMNHVRQLSELTTIQYNITMHHLARLERAGFLYLFARFSIEKSLIERMLECTVIPDNSEHRRPNFSLEDLEKCAQTLINLDKLFTII